MTLEAEGGDPITVSVNSAGGELAAMFTVTDTMRAMRAPVGIRALRRVEGTAAALVAAGTGRRRAAPHAQFVLRLPEAEVSGSAADVERAARAEGALGEQLLDLLALATNRPRAETVRDWEQRRMLSAHEALAAGLIDAIE